MPCYFFSGAQYIRVTRGQTGPGFVDLEYPEPLANWGWGEFGKNGIDAAMNSGSKCYFFSGNQYLRVTRGTTGAGVVDAGYPQPIANWGWGNFGKNGIDAALQSGTKCYFFSGKQYIRVTRGETGAGTVDQGYPQPISNWGWGEFGQNGIDAALNSGPADYFFSGNQYIRVTRGDAGAGVVDPGYPAAIAQWGWGQFAAKRLDAALFSGTDVPVGAPVAPPPRLGDNSNYFIHDNGNPLTGVVVTINIEQDLVFKSATITDGYSFQLNAYGPKNGAGAFQQYVLGLHDGQVWGSINCYAPRDVAEGPQGIVDSNNPMLDISNYNLKAGYQLKISLLNDASNAITGATFQVINNAGQQLAQKTFPVVALNPPRNGPAPGVTAPIVAFVMNLVGADNQAHAIFSSGSGSIICQANNRLSVTNDFPAFVDNDSFTVELGTSVYGELNAGPDVGLVQHFGVTPDGSFV